LQGNLKFLMRPVVLETGFQVILGHIRDEADLPGPAGVLIAEHADEPLGNVRWWRGGRNLRCGGRILVRLGWFGKRDWLFFVRIQFQMNISPEARDVRS